MRTLLRIWAIFAVAAKRLVAQRWLAVATAVGLLMAIAVALSIPLYADAVYTRMLRQELWGTPEATATDLPLTLLFRFIGGWQSSLEWEDVVAADTFISKQATSIMRLPVRHFVRHFRTDTLGLYALEGGAYDRTQDPVAWVSFGFADDFSAHTTLVEGQAPAEPSLDATGVDVLISERLATELGLQTGEQFIAFAQTQGEQSVRTTEVPVRIAGVWRADDPADAYWFSEPAKLEQVLFVPENTYRGRLAADLEDEVYIALWYLVFDGTGVSARDVGYLANRILSVRQRFVTLLPAARLDTSPLEALSKYWQASNVLKLLLYAFSVPILGLIFAFVGLVVSLAVGRQRNETAVLRSRGATVGQIVGIAALEATILGLLALALGVPSGEGIARLMGRVRTFLDFSLDARLEAQATSATLVIGGVTAALAVVAQVLPAIGAARHTVVTYKRERARSLRPPWWQRAALDVLLLVPTAYGGYLLRQQGGLVVPGVDAAAANDPFQNPLLFLVPSLGVFALTLLMLRVLPWLMSLVAWVAARLKAVGFLMAARHLARTSGFYAAPLVLLTMTLSLSAFVASLAQTMDNHLYDQSYYQIGADMRLIEQGEATALQALGTTFGVSGTDDSGGGPRWHFLPVSEHLEVEGVRAAARVAHYVAYAHLSGKLQPATFIGLDRADFAGVAFWRDDFAPTNLGTMMNTLAAVPNGVLVPLEVYQTHYLSTGDRIQIAIDTLDKRTDIAFEVVGVFELFPTWYPTDEKQGPLFVGNLDYVFQAAGAQSPYNVWLRTDPQVPYAQIAAGVTARGLNVVYWQAPRLAIAAEQQRPERQGLFGILSVGFVAAALLTVVGFILYALSSFRTRFIELGVLRAIGLSARHMAAFLAWELLFLMAIGIGAGTGLGVWMSNLFIPYLQVGSGPAAQVPPFVVQISWPDVFRFYVLFGLLFVGALGVLVALLLRMKIFQAIKLGEAA